jgi:hypothetical protein
MTTCPSGVSGITLTQSGVMIRYTSWTFPERGERARARWTSKIRHVSSDSSSSVVQSPGRSVGMAGVLVGWRRNRER